MAHVSFDWRGSFAAAVPVAATATAEGRPPLFTMLLEAMGGGGRLI